MGLLHIKFVNLKATLSVLGHYKFPVLVLKPFTAKLSELNWEQVFAIKQKDLGNGKLDIKFKSVEESKITFNAFLPNIEYKKHFDFKSITIQMILSSINGLDYNPLKIHLGKISQIILETLQSDIK